MKNAFGFSQPFRHTTSRFGLIALALLVVLLTGCDSTDAMEEPVPQATSTDEPVSPPAPEPAPAPGITMSSFEVTLADGGQGLQFFAQANADVFYKKVTINPPPPFERITYNLNNAFIIQEESIALQNANTAYRKVGGAWTFVYEVSLGTGANARDHTVTVTYSIAGKKVSVPGADSALLGTVLR